MSSKPSAKRKWKKEDEKLLVSLREPPCLDSWAVTTERFNRRVPKARSRTKPALVNKYKYMVLLGTCSKPADVREEPVEAKLDEDPVQESGHIGPCEGSSNGWTTSMTTPDTLSWCDIDPGIWYVFAWAAYSLRLISVVPLRQASSDGAHRLSGGG